MSNKKIVKLLHGGGSPNISRQIIEQALADLDNTTRYFHEVYAPLIRAKYEALLAQGFKEAEALELCKSLL